MDGGTDTGGAAEGTMVELAEIMTADVFTVAPDTPVVAVAVAAAMVKRRLGSAVVMQGADVGGNLHGARRLAGGGVGSRPGPLTHVPVDDTRPGDRRTQCGLGASGRDHARQRVPPPPGRRGDALVGIVSLRDLLSVRVRRHLS